MIGVMRNLHFCYMHYMVTIYTDSCRFFSFSFFFFVVGSMENVHIYIYIVST